MPDFQSHDATFHYEKHGLPLNEATLHVVWGHGWGQDHTAFAAMAQALGTGAAHTLIDFPGFGRSPPPPAVWGTEDYADAIAAWLATLPPVPVLWVGHSFGGRVGLRLAARHPDSVRGLFLIASAGLKRRRPPHRRLQLYLKVRLYKILRKLAGAGFSPEWLQKRLGSTDYRNAGVMRPVFVRTVNEDQTESVRKIGCPVQLVYGADDTETPPEIGERLADLIFGARLTVLPAQDHYSVLGEGRHQVLHHLHEFMGATAQANEGKEKTA